MTQKAIIREQLRSGLPEAWITDDLIEALEYARGGARLKFPAPELADSRHAEALLRLAAKIEEAE